MLTAGVLKEVVFRLVVLPGAYAALRRTGAGDLAASLGAIVAAGLLFAVSHELGEGPFRPDHFATRALFPGVAMSAAFRWIAQAFVIGAHSGAHLVMPLLFV